MYKEITIEELKKQEGKWAVWIDSVELHEKLSSHFNLCKYYGPYGYSNYCTFSSSAVTLSSSIEYWTEKGKDFFFIVKQNYEIY